MSMLTEAYSREFNPHISTDPVSLEGYTKSDLEGYYNSTFLLWESPEGCQPVQVRGLESKTSWHVDTLEGARTVPVTELHRLVIPVGFYIVRNKLASYQYLLKRSYKKGLHPDFARIRTVGKSNRHMSLEDMLQLMYPIDSNRSSRIVTRRLAIHDGKLLTHYKTMSVGSYKAGSADTPFPCIRQRLESSDG